MQIQRNFSPVKITNKEIQSPHYIPDDAMSNSISFSKKKSHYYIAKNVKELKENSLFHLTANNLQGSKLELKSAIKEEENEDEVLNTSLHDMTESMPANIFQVSKNYDTSSFAELNTGPKFKKTGELIPYSIVGKPDVFLKNYNIIKKGLPNMKSYNNILEDNKTPRSVVNFKKSETKGLNANPSLSRKQSFKSTSESIEKAQQSPLKKVPLKKVDREQLLQQLANFESIRAAALLEDKKKLQELKLSDRIYVTKEKRIMEKFERDNEKWKENIEKTCKSISRSLDKTVMLQYEEYRRNKEKAEEIEKLKDTIKKRLDLKDERSELYWYLSLRNYPQNSNSIQPQFASHNKCKQINDENSLKNMARLTLLQDLPSGFQTGVVEVSRKELEKIREPFLKRIKGGLNKTSTSMTGMTGKYNMNLMDMLNETDKISDIKETNTDELEDLEVFPLLISIIKQVF